MSPSIQISEELLNELNKRQIHPKDSYEDIIWDLLEHQFELREEIVKVCEKGKKDYLMGIYVTIDEVFK